MRAAVHEWHRVRSTTPEPAHHATTPGVGGHHHEERELPFLDPVPELDSIQAEQTRRFAQ